MEQSKHAARRWMSFGIGVLALAVWGLAGCGGSSGGTTTTVASNSAAPGACLSSYVPNYGNAILTSSDPNVAGRMLKWTVSPIKIYFTKDANWTQTLEDAAKGAISTWPSALGSSNISLVYTTNQADAQITVQFVPSNSLGAGVLGVTTDTYSTSGILSSAVVQVGKGVPITDFAQTFAHEFGHALGISGHSPYPQDLMYYAQLATSPSGPVQRDVNTLLGDYCGSFAASTQVSGRAAGEPLQTVRIIN